MTRKCIFNLLLVLLLSSSASLAASGAESAGPGLLVILFCVLGATIVVCQLVPSLLLFFGLLKGLLSASAGKTLSNKG